MQQEPVTKQKKWALPEELPDAVALFLSRAMLVGGLVLVALLLGKGQIAFVLFSIAFLYLGRRTGWWLSKASLYGDPLPMILVELLIWGWLGRLPHPRSHRLESPTLDSQLGFWLRRRRVCFQSQFWALCAE